MPHMTFELFRTVYIHNLDAYLPIHITADEEFSEKNLIRLNIELIAPHRMTDGPSKFFRVITIDVNEQQYAIVRGYASMAGERWQHNLMVDAKDCFKYSNQFQEK